MSRSPRRPPAEPATARAPGTRLPLVVLATLAVLVTAADTYVVVLALPDILTGVGVGLDELQRATPIVGGFLLGYTATLPLLGRLADLRGRVPVLVGCLLLFALGSLLTATADSLGPAVLGRGLQGIGAGGLVPATLALVADRWPPERPVAAARRRRRGAGGRCRARAAGRRGGPGRGRLAGDLLAQPAARPGAGRRCHGVGPGPASRPVGLALAVVAALALGLQLAAPAALAEDVTLGLLYVPLVPSLDVRRRWSWSRSWPAPGWSPAASPVRTAPCCRCGGCGGWRREVDVLGSALAVVALGSLVWAFAAADPATQVVAHGPVLLPVALVAARRVRRPRAPDARPGAAARARCGRSARGARCWSTCSSGVALVAALVDVPLFARDTTTPGDQLGAALVLLRLLVAVPVGAVAGGWLCRAVAPRLVAAGGMALAALAFVAMTSWDERSLDGAWSTVVLLAAGLGFGLAIAPVNAVLLAVTGSDVHGSASALAVVARTVGMLVGLSLLTAVALRRFTAEVAAISTPFELCPRDAGRLPGLRRRHRGGGPHPAAHRLRRRRDRRGPRGGRRPALLRTGRSGSPAGTDGVTAARRPLPRLLACRRRRGGGHGQLRISLLGACTASSGAPPLDLGGRRQRAVLAVLLLARGEVVPAERLAESRLGRRAARPTPRAPLQSYVSHLRRRLQPAARPATRSAVIVSEGRGYAVRLPPDAVDAWRFEQLLDRAGDARRPAAGSEPARARRSRCGAGRRWPSTPTSRGRRPRSPG